MKKRLFPLLIALAMLLSLAACGGAATDPSAAPSADATVTPAPVVDD